MPGMGSHSRGESPLGEEVVLIPSRRQRRHREVGSERSQRRNPAPRNTNRVQGGTAWVSWPEPAKPDTANRAATQPRRAQGGGDCFYPGRTVGGSPGGGRCGRQ